MIHQSVLIHEFYINDQIHCTSRNFTATCQCVMVKCFKWFQRLLKECCPGFGGPYLTIASSVYWDWSHPVAREDPWRQHLQAYSLRWGGGSRHLPESSSLSGSAYISLQLIWCTSIYCHHWSVTSCLQFRWLNDDITFTASRMTLLIKLTELVFVLLGYAW